jgi:hypothetical protein
VHHEPGRGRSHGTRRDSGIRPQASRGAVVPPHPSPWLLLRCHLQPLATPDPLGPIRVYLPALLMEQRRHATVAVTAVFVGKTDNHAGQRCLIRPFGRNISPGILRMPEQATDASSPDQKLLSQNISRLPASFGARKFLSATSSSISFYRPRPATSFLSCWFFFARFFNPFA